MSDRTDENLGSAEVRVVVGRIERIARTGVIRSPTSSNWQMSATGMAGIVDRASRLLEHPSARARIASEGDDTYEFRIFRDWMRLATVFEELEHLLNLMTRARTFQEVRALLKMYVVSWMTQSDALANIVNEVFELGIPPPGGKRPRRVASLS